MHTPTAALFLAAVLTAHAAGAAPGTVLVAQRAWVLATPPGATVAAAYLTLDNRGHRPDRLVSVSSPRAARIEVHTILREGDLVRMRRVDPLRVAAGERLMLEPGGTHLMLMDLASPLRAGERVPLALRFEVAGEILIDAAVLAATDPAPGHKHH